MTRKQYEEFHSEYATMRNQLNQQFHNAMLKYMYGWKRETQLDNLYTYTMGQEL